LPQPPQLFLSRDVPGCTAREPAATRVDGIRPPQHSVPPPQLPALQLQPPFWQVVPLEHAVVALAAAGVGVERSFATSTGSPAVV